MRDRYAQQGLRRAGGFAAALFPVLQGAGGHTHQGGEFGLRHAEPVARFDDGGNATWVVRAVFPAFIC